MNKLIMSLSIIFIGITSVYSQSLNIIPQENNLQNVMNKANNSHNLASINTFFTYMFITNTSDNYTNSKGFSLDLQINQTNYTSWLVGFNMNFYKRFTNIGTFDLSIINLLAGPKFYLNKDKLSTYFRLNIGVTFFSQHTPGFQNIAVSLFPAVGLEYTISKYFKLTLEPNLNCYYDLMRSGGYYSINAGLSTTIY